MPADTFLKERAEMLAAIERLKGALVATGIVSEALANAIADGDDSCPIPDICYGEGEVCYLHDLPELEGER